MGDGDHDGSREGRDPCIPDFILRSAGAGAGGRGTVIVETMGYADEAYRLRKARMHEIMSAALEGALVVLHEMSGAGRGEKRDRTLWRGAMAPIAGSRNSSVHCVAQKTISVKNMTR